MLQRLVIVFAILALASPGPALAADPADPELEAGIEQVREGAFEEAALALDGVVRRLAVGGPTKDQARAQVYLSIAYLELGQEPRARETFLAALQADPRLETTDREFPPKYLRFFDTVRPQAPAISAEQEDQAEASGASVQEASEEEGGGGKKMLLILGGVAVAGGVALAAGGGGGSEPADPASVDDDGDGFSENQGDCNDRDPGISPSGSFEFAMDWAYQGGPFNCSQLNPRTQTYRVTNRSCATLTLQSLTYIRNGAGTCNFTSDGDLRMRMDSLPSGASEVIREGTSSGQAAAICCPEPPCRTGTCELHETVTLSTSSGSRSLSNSYAVEDPTGYDCHVCGTHFNPMSRSDCESPATPLSSP